MRSQKRMTMNAPCGVEMWDTYEREFRTEYPAVRCEYKCDFCGFNPNEQTRRLTEGKVFNITKTHKLRDEHGTVVDVITNNCKTIHFTKEAVNA